MQLLGEFVDATSAGVDVIVQRQVQQFSFAEQLRVLRLIHRQVAVMVVGGV